ncbi:MAG: competence/damage-inducible protein A [Bacteroidales bacterium]
MKAEIISIGDELLIGQVINTNAAWMGQELSLIGIPVHQITIISDTREHIITAMKEAESRAEIILITGGLGPTRDDITKQTLCEYFDTHLVFDEASFENINRLFPARGLPVTDLNRKQAEVPAYCRPVLNKNGTAPGMWFEKQGKIFISMPGVPFEMKPMMTDLILPELASLSHIGIFHKTVLTQGVGESFLAEKIKVWEDQLPANMKLAYLPQPGIVRLRLSAYSGTNNELQTAVEEQIRKLHLIIPGLIFGYDEDTLEEILGRLLREKKQTLVTAESCTGGYLAHKITSVPGSSEYFLGSIISYSNELKIKLLDIAEKDIIDHGAVSEVVARAMACNARKKLQADYAIAISGIAGPDGGTPEKPVGTTWIAIATPEKVISEKFMFGEHRERNIHRTAITALNMLRKIITSGE